MAHLYIETAFIVLIIGALVAGLVRSWRGAGWTAVAFVGLAAALCAAAGLEVLFSGQAAQGSIAALPGFGSRLAVSLDPLGAAFLLIIAAVSFVATLFSVGYMGMYVHESPGRFYSLLQLFLAGMMGVVCVADWLFFIVFWELMTLVSYFLVTFERGDPAVIRAGFKYLIMTHVATAGLLVAAIVLWRSTGSFSFEMHRTGLAGMSSGLRSLLLALYFIAFATKAGIFPFGDWLPDAHPAAPSGVSAILSGVMIKLGAYGVLRVFWQALRQTGKHDEMIVWGVIIAAFGTLSAVVGGLTAMRENDTKRLLAFSSISQTGYIFLALGIGITFAGRVGLTSLAMLGFLGAGFHILNDAIYKSLLFMNAGAIQYAGGTRDLNRLGGLAAVAPVTAIVGLVGILSLSGLPPTNGFASKWVIYQACISGGMQFAPMVVMAVIAFFASLSTLAYSLKFYGTAFLGRLATAREPMKIPATMDFAQGLLAVACLVVGLVPIPVMRLISWAAGKHLSDVFVLGRAGGLFTASSGGAVPAAWSPIAFTGALVVCFLAAEILRASGKARARTVVNWYGGEEQVPNEVRFRAAGLYAPFLQVFANVYPHVPVPRLPSIKKLRSVIDFDAWLYNPLVRVGGRGADKISRSHVGIPQLYMVWQVGGVILVVGLLFLLVR